MDNIKWGMIGTGRIARAFAEALKGTQGAELYAVGSRMAEKAAAFSGNYGFKKWYGSYDELIADKEVDVVYVATPMASHYHDCMNAILHGKNVLCEKTVTLNSAQLQKLLDAAKEKNVFFMEGMWMKCRPAYIKMKEWIEQGKIGEIKYVKAEFCNFVKHDPTDRLFRADCGGGALLDAGVYPLTLAADVLGTPKEIISSANMRDGVDMSNSLILRYENGAFASVDSGFEVALRNNAVISGTDGSVLLGDWFFLTNSVTLLDKEGETVEKFRAEERINGFEFEIEEVDRCLNEGLKESPLVPHSITMQVMRIMDKAREQWGMKFPDESV